MITDPNTNKKYKLSSVEEYIIRIFKININYKLLINFDFLPSEYESQLST